MSCRWNGKALFWAALSLAGLLLALCAAAAISEIYPAVGLRYALPLSAQQVEAAQADTQENDDSRLYPTFWREQTETVKGPYAEASLTVIACMGDCHLAYSADFLAGTWPGECEAGACALSDTAAWQLFGSEDVLGLTLARGQKSCRIVGVFHDARSVCVYAGEADAGYTAVELAGMKSGDARTAADTFARVSGLDTPESVVYGPDMGRIAQLAAGLPLGVAGLFALLALVRTFSLFKRPRRGPFLWAAAVALALVLPALLARLPLWAVPAQWSDFAFWGRLWQAAGVRFEEWLALTPCTKDVRAKLCLLRLAAGCGLSLWAESLLYTHVGFCTKSEDAAASHSASSREKNIVPIL